MSVRVLTLAITALLASPAQAEILQERSQRFHPQWSPGGMVASQERWASQAGAEILALFESLKQQGHTIILITHDEHVAAHADRICHMLDGVLTEESAHVA